MCGSIIATGVPSTGAGEVFINERAANGSFLLTQVLSVGLTGDRFGQAVALFEDRLAVSSPDSDVDFGTVFVFERNPSTGVFELQTTISGSTLVTEGGIFGTALSISGDHMVAGISDHLERTGQAFIFTRRLGDGQWVFSTELVRDDPAIGDLFGFHSSIEVCPKLERRRQKKAARQKEMEERTRLAEVYGQRAVEEVAALKNHLARVKPRGRDELAETIKERSIRASDQKIDQSTIVRTSLHGSRLYGPRSPLYPIFGFKHIMERLPHRGRAPSTADD